MPNKNYKKNICIPKKEKTVGILGGMGPLSTAYLFRKIIELTPVKRDQLHLRIIIDNNPKIPDRTESILNKDNRIIFHLIGTAKNLQKAGADFILLACNTSHCFLKEIQSHVAVPIFNMIKLTIDLINDSNHKPRNIGLLATDGTLGEMLYQRCYQSHKINWITLKETEQRKLMALIYGIKAGQKHQYLKHKFKNFLVSLKRSGAEYIILGCTELSLFKDMFNHRFKLVDPIEILAAEAIRFSKR